MHSREETLAAMRDFMVGPPRFANLLACFELGIFGLLRESTAGLSAEDIAAKAGVARGAVEQLMLLAVKEGFVSYDEARGVYAPAGLGELSDDDVARVAAGLNMVKVACLRQLYYVSDSVRERTVVGLRELYGFNGILYEAAARHRELRDAWAPVMDLVTSIVDPWFLDHVDIGDGAHVLDVAGNTGLGAVLAYQHKQARDPRVVCFDFPEKEAEAVRNFRSHGVDHRCSFIGGDVFSGLPGGFDVVLIKNFLEMFDAAPAHTILQNARAALKPGGRLYLLAPVHPENPEDSHSVDFFPAYFLACTMGQGGPQKLSTYVRWMEECGFQVSSTTVLDTASLAPDGFFSYGVVCGATT